MPLIIPQLDDRTYREILQDALARIPVHTPEWTNFNDSDPGVTLLQLFAFMSESLLFRSNLIPERNRLKFIQLLGIPLRPATPAVGVVTFTNERGPLSTVTLPPNVAVFAGKIGFMTGNGLDVLPVDARLYRRRRLSQEEIDKADKVYKQLYATQADPNTDLEYYETAPVDPPASGAALPVIDLNADTVDASLWLALLKRKADQASAASVLAELAGKTITLGVMPFVENATRVLAPGGSATTAAAPRLLFEITTGKLEGGLPVYRRLDSRADDDPLQKLTIVQAPLPGASEMGAFSDLDPLEEGVGDFPPSLEDESIKDLVLAWIRIRVDDGGTGVSSPASQARLSWVGMNAARVSQRVRVAAEAAGTGSGEPDQAVTLVNTPVIPESVSVFVGDEVWARIDDLLAAPPEVAALVAAGQNAQLAADLADPRVYTVDRESGLVSFGDGLHGKRVPKDAPIVVSYDYGGGRAGNVGIGAIKVSPDLPPGFKAANPLPAWSGDDGETVDQAERQIPRYLLHRDRAVSAQDFRDIVLRTPGVDIGRVEVIPLYDPRLDGDAPGAVTVLVIPFDPARLEAPQPNRLFLDAVCKYLDPRRILTTEIFVYGPDYRGLSVSVGIDVVAGRDIAPVREAAKQAVRQYLSPLFGGQEGTGWPLSTNVEDRDIFAVATRVDGVSRVREVRMWDDAGKPTPTLEITGLKLPRLDRISVTAGDAEDLVAAAAAAAGAEKPRKRLPVPVLPAEC